MPTNTIYIIFAATALVFLTFLVGIALLVSRIREMREKRLHPQSVATANKMAVKLENVQPADNFRNLFETPVLFYALVAVAAGIGYVPSWLVTGAWIYVALRVVHSVIHCTYNNVMHRLGAFLLSFALLTAMWIAYAVNLAATTAG
jgi:hypothetical protein